MLFTWNLSPLQSSKISFEYLLLPPRSALERVSAEFTLCLHNFFHVLLLILLSLKKMAEYKWAALAPSIFRAGSFGR